MSISQEKFDSLIGKRFGMLTVIEKDPQRPSSHLICRCDCGGSKSLLWNSLIYHRTQDCGCQRSAKAKIAHGIDNLVGKTVGRWHIDAVVGKAKSSHQWVYACTCVCGAKKEIERQYLIGKHPKSTSCGCWKQEQINTMAKERKVRSESKMIGKRFGKVVVVSRSEQCVEPGRRGYLCRCDCGTEFVASGHNLRSGQTCSCGCGHYSPEALERFKRYREEKGFDPNFLMQEEAKFIRRFSDVLRSVILLIDNSHCQLCKQKFSSSKLHLHHVDPIHKIDIKNPKTYHKIYDLENQVMLCRGCHKKAHPKGFRSIDPDIQMQLFKITRNRVISDVNLRQYHLLVETKVKPYLKLTWNQR